MTPFETFLITGGGDYIASGTFEQRCVALFDRFERGEVLTLEEAAKAVRLPVRVFGQIYIEWIAVQLLGEAANATRH